MDCSDVSVLHEVVNKGENALMFSIANSSGLSEQLVKLINNLALCESMSEEKYELEKINEEMLQFYRKTSQEEDALV